MISRYVVIACLCAAGSVYSPWLVAVALGFIVLEALSPKLQRERAMLIKYKAALQKQHEALDKDVKEELQRLKTQVAMLTGARRQ